MYTKRCRARNFDQSSAAAVLASPALVGGFDAIGGPGAPAAIVPKPDPARAGPAWRRQPRSVLPQNHRQIDRDQLFRRSALHPLAGHNVTPLPWPPCVPCGPAMNVHFRILGISKLIIVMSAINPATGQIVATHTSNFPPRNDFITRHACSVRVAEFAAFDPINVQLGQLRLCLVL